MRAGPLRHQITIESYSESTDALGQRSKSWSTLATRQGNIKPLSGRELANAKETHADITHEIRLRYVANVSPANRIIFDSRTFELLSVINVEERNRELACMAKEVV